MKQLNLSGNLIPTKLLAELEGVSEDEIRTRYGYSNHPDKIVEYCRRQKR